ncbi:MAG TPA: FAD:protein FMN transferase [Candidatus Paceibacterota bacterium]|nr:FAD:protein FMN transferase [Candidatus Paceibacterota bacterium]
MKKEYEFSGKAMGTEFSIAIISDYFPAADAASKNAIDSIHEYESRFSRFIPQSELSRINEEKDMIVSNEFMDVIEKSYTLFVLTGGIFNPLVQIKRFGYTKDFSEIEDSAQLLNENLEEYNIDFSSTLIDSKNHKVVLQDGQQLDFGGFLKGYLAELLCKQIMTSSPHITGAIVNIGGDLYTEGKDSNGETFLFDIYNPITQSDDTTIPIFNSALATSGTYKRIWKSDGVQTNHILDISGIKNPETAIVSSSVIHPDGGKAEAFAKVLLSIEKDRALQILKPEDIGYILITNTGELVRNI